MSKLEIAELQALKSRTTEAAAQGMITGMEMACGDGS